jgi:hypothetical protein
MDPNPLSNFKVGNSDTPISYWEIRNHQEMRQWVMKTIPHLIYNEAFLEIVTELEMQRFLELKLKKQDNMREVAENI